MMLEIPLSAGELQNYNLLVPSNKCRSLSPSPLITRNGMPKSASFHDLKSTSLDIEDFSEDGNHHKSDVSIRNANESNEVNDKRAAVVVATVTIFIFLVAFLLVGISLSLTPQIDEILRKETDKIIGALTSSVTISPEGRSNNETTATTVKPG